MSVSMIGSTAPAASSPPVQAAAPASTPSPSSPATLAPDTVSLSHAGKQAAQGGDVDRDGDSH